MLITKQSDTFSAGFHYLTMTEQDYPKHPGASRKSTALSLYIKQAMVASLGFK
jgi:hypothetical protein